MCIWRGCSYHHWNHIPLCWCPHDSHFLAVASRRAAGAIGHGDPRVRCPPRQLRSSTSLIGYFLASARNEPSVRNERHVCLSTAAPDYSGLFEHNAAIYWIDGRAMPREQQLLDSTNITENVLLSELLFPLGMRYHALHHLFPRLPYHNLGIAHRRLMFHLPDDLPYRETVYPTWLAVVRKLLMNVRRHS